MIWLIGTDEAGYGPNLGPLVVSATLWSLAEQPSKGENISQNIQYLNEALQSLCHIKGAFPIVDSKKLYQKTNGLAALEKTVLTALHIIGSQATDNEEIPSSLEELLLILGNRTSPPFWETDEKLCLPYSNSHLSQKENLASVNLFVKYFTDKGIALKGVRSQRINPAQYNARTLEMSKSDLLAEVTLELASHFVEVIVREQNMVRGHNDKSDSIHTDRIVLLCDKLGGRKHYRPLLEAIFPEAFVFILQEEPMLSVYRLTWKDTSVEIRFQMRGESNIPTALASIFSKYIRELSMSLFNKFWQQKIVGLQPTAGYPQDAKRFWKEILPLIDQLGYGVDDIWRNI